MLGAIGVVQLTREVDVAAATAAAVRAGVWLRPFRDLIYTMPPYVTGDEDLALICRGALAAVGAAVSGQSASAPGGATGEGAAVASVTGLAPAVKRARSLPCTSRPGIGSPGGPPGEHLDRERRRAHHQDRVAEAPAPQHRRVRDQAGVREDRPRRRDLRPRVR